MKFFKEAARKVFLSFLILGLVFTGISNKNTPDKPDKVENKTVLATTTKADLTGGSVYEIVIDRFYDGDSSNNATGEAFRYTENSQDDFRYMHGGDWKGVIDKMDYIKNMGYTAIWISPVGDPQLWGVPDSTGKQWPTAYHGYNVYDPNRANRYFGAQDPTTSKEILKQLVDAAHAKGIQVILDVVPNHVGDYLQGTGSNAHYITNNGNLKTGTQVQPASPFNNVSWYHNLGDIVDWNNATECENHDLGGLDDIDQDNSSAKAAMNSSIQNWFTYTGADAARVDAAKCMNPTYIHTIETDSNIQSFGECFDMSVDKVAGYVGSTKEWGMLDFPLFQSIVNDFAYGQNFNDMSSTTTNSIQNTFSQDYKYNGYENHMVTFIDNHDRNRFLTEAGGNTSKLKNAITFLLTARGVPTILYGTEQNKGNDGNNYINGIADTYNRWDMVKKDASGNVITDYFNPNTDTYQLIGKLNGLRQNYEALRNGKQREMWSSTNFYAFSRRVDSGSNLGQEVICAFSNKQDASQTVTMPLRTESTLAVGTTLVNLLNTSETVVVQAGGVTGKQITVTVGSNSAKVFAVPTGSKPTAPTNLAAPTKTSSSVTLSWTASTSSLGIAGYMVYRNGTNVTSNLVTGTSYTDTGLQPNTTYSYYVVAKDNAGTLSDPSVSISATTLNGGTSNKATIYYKRGFTTPYFHYQKPDGTWTTVPGIAMTGADSTYPGYSVIENVDMGTNTQLIGCFNDGNGNWDSNGGKNYTFPVGISTFAAGVISSGTPPTSTLIPVTFTVNNATTTLGQNVYIAGNVSQLGNWSTASAAGPASCTNTYPTWTLTVNLPAGQTIQFKAIKKDASNNVVWEGGNNHSYTVPSSGSGSVTFTWQN